MCETTVILSVLLKLWLKLTVSRAITWEYILNTPNSKVTKESSRKRREQMNVERWFKDSFTPHSRIVNFW